MNRFRPFVLVLLAASTTVNAEPVTAERIAAIAEADRAPWQTYRERSDALARADAAALQVELAAAGLTVAVRAPDGGDFKLSAKPGDPWFASDEAKQLADVVLSYQTPSGGWSKHTGYARGPRKPGMQWSSQYEPGRSPHYLATFDNRSTTEQLYFLANVWHATGREDCRAGFVKGLEFVLTAQYPNGGWPQVFPLEGGYHDDVTFNDDAMTRVLELLQTVVEGGPTYALVDDALRDRCRAAFEAGVKCVMRAQVVIDGTPTVWCAQYDALTLRPAPARKMEPATLSGVESARVLAMLMKIRGPSPEVIASVESGLAWLERAKVTGVSRVERDGKTVYVLDPASTDVYWARFYDIGTGRPVFPGRDGVLYDTFEAMAAKNPVGYDYYSTLPGSIVSNGQKKWRKMLADAGK